MYMSARVLLIDSEPLVCDNLRRKLEWQGYDVRWARDGQGSVRNADFRQIDLLLIDLDASPAESLEIVSRIAGANPFLGEVGLTERRDLPEAAFRAGLSAVAEKPIDDDGLYLVMEELLMRVPVELGTFRLVPRRVTKLEDNRRGRPAVPDICPAAYSGWGINE
jgi:DNA-binding NtrC family response regulator